MKWMTGDHVHVDGVSASWLIKTAVDPYAEFLFVPEEELPIAEGFASLDMSDDERLRLQFPVYDALDAYMRQATASADSSS